MQNEEFIEENENLIAIVGMAGRFPQAPSVSMFWQNLLDAKESIRFFSEEELIEAGVDPAMVKHPKYVKAAAALDDIDKFDADFFSMTPAEAKLLDPQQRLFLESVWHAIEDAACDPERFDGRIGVYAGCAISSYLIQNLLTNPSETEKLGATQAQMSNDKDFLPTRASYLLNLTGPSVSVGTACSTSLVAVHQAVQSLLSFESDMALAGGASIRTRQIEGHLYQESGILSPDGHCRPFDAKAQGTVVGSGVGVVALKRLQEAIDNKDNIYAVIRGSAINNDGQVKVGFTAPSLSGQAEVITEAQAIAGVDASDVGYIEAHGTGTVLGDPIEVAALTQAFNACDSENKNKCALGSLKSNMGHLDSAAGVAGLIKAALSVKTGVVPASLNYHEPNPKINFSESPFFVLPETKAWSDIEGINQAQRIASVSSFGIGGTNAHVVVEQPPEQSEGASSCDQMFLFSAKSSQAISEQRKNLQQYLNEYSRNISDVAYTLQEGRKAFEKRHALLVKDGEHAISLLSDDASGFYGECLEDPAIVFLFSGQGSQYRKMAESLYLSSEPFKEHFDQCNEIVFNQFQINLKDIIFETEKSGLINETKYTQPAVFSLEYALARTLEEWGVTPNAMVGHSIGEYVAATFAGVFTLEDALKIVVHRGRLMQSCEPGSMISVEAPIEKIRSYLGGQVSLAAHNSCKHCVLSGPTEEIEALVTNFDGKEIKSKLLKTSHAFHSQMMEPILVEFESLFTDVNLKIPEKPFVSNVSGDWIQPDEATSPKYWARQLRSSVEFSDGIDCVRNNFENIIWLEIGPGKALSSLVRAHIQDDNSSAKFKIVNTLPQATEAKDSFDEFRQALAKLWLYGVNVDWAMWHGEDSPRRLSLPQYPFQQKSFWVPPGKGMAMGGPGFLPEEQWQYLPSWKRVPLAEGLKTPSLDQILVISDDSDFVKNFIVAAQGKGCNVIVAEVDDAFSENGRGKYTINPQDEEDYLCLIDCVKSTPLDAIVYALGIDGSNREIEEGKTLSFYSPLYLLKALKEENFTEKASIFYLSQYAHSVIGNETLNSEQSLYAGPLYVGGIELPYLRSRWVDIENLVDSGKEVSLLLDELARQDSSDVVAFRFGARWSSCFTKTNIDISPESVPQLKREASYLITGGLGGMGLTFSEMLAEEYNANIILLGRRELPEQDAWSTLVNDPECDDKIKRTLLRLLKIKEKAKGLVYYQCDASDGDRLSQVVDTAEQAFGAISGVIHAAGVPGSGLIQQKQKEQAAKVMAPKVEGSNNLLSAFKTRENLDFIVYCSSLSAQLGLLGQVDYTSANAYQDALAAKWDRKAGFRVISINWDGWKESGMAKDNETPLSQDHVIHIGLSDEEGARQLKAILASSFTQVLVSTLDLDQRREEIKNIQAAAKIPKVESERPDLSTAYIEPRDEIEKQLTTMLSELLGISPIGIFDDFFELGGHSLLAVNYCSRVAEMMNVEVSVAELFERPNIAALAEIISSKKMASVGEDDLDSMLDELESMSDEDVQRMLEQE
ncbi:MAG: SDR family NAD(P)-dependent oxidoreductase [Agarilytica sp.]